jgi:hypothetical protein
MRIVIRLVVLALAGYGAWKIYEEYGSRMPEVRGDLDEFTTRTTDAARDAAEHVSSSASEAADAIKKSTADIESAAKDAQANLTRTLREAPSGSTGASS